jgi:hypothetical protein
MIEHRRLGIGSTHHRGGPPDGGVSYHTCGERRRGFVNTLLGIVFTRLSIVDSSKKDSLPNTGCLH